MAICATIPLRKEIWMLVRWVGIPWWNSEMSLRESPGQNSTTHLILSFIVGCIKQCNVQNDYNAEPNLLINYT